MESRSGVLSSRGRECETRLSDGMRTDVRVSNLSF